MLTYSLVLAYSLNRLFFKDEQKRDKERIVEIDNNTPETGY